MKKNLVVFLHQNIWDQSSLESLEVEKYKKKSNIIAYELGYFTNKKLVDAFKNKTNKNFIKTPLSFSEWKLHFSSLIRKYKKNKILIINKVKPTNLWSYLVLLEISKLNINIVEFKNSGVPIIQKKKTTKERIKIIFNPYYILKLLEIRIFLFLSLFIRFNNYKYLISGKPSKKISKKKIIYGSSWDMAKTFNKNKKLNINTKFAVYIESTIAHYGDQIILGPNAAIINKKKWFKDLNQFFQFVENHCRLKVIIAAHPKINHKHLKKRYENRRVISNKTKELIIKSNLVLFERSSAINYIIKFKKPAIMIHNNETISTSYNSQIQSGFSKLTGIKNINIENFSKNDFSKLFLVDRKRYLKFYKEYMNFKNLTVPNYKIISKSYLSH